MKDIKQTDGLGWLLNVITCVITFISYAIMIDVLNVQTDTPPPIDVFRRDAFIFIIPCAIEGMYFITSKVQKKDIVDKVELIINLLSMGLSAVLFFKIIMNKDITYVELVEILLLSYPLKFAVNSFDGLIDLLKAR